MKKILFIKLSSLGDIIHAYPAIYDIRQHFPDCKIDWLVDESFYELVKLNKLVDEVIPIPLRKWKKNLLEFIPNIIKWKKNLVNTKYDYIIDAQGLIKSSLLTKCFSGTVYGFDTRSVKEKAACLFYKNKIKVSKSLLALTKNRILAREIFNYQINLEDVNFGLSYNNSKHLELIPNSDYVIFFHATSKQSKKYPIKYWANLANHLIAKYDLKIILPFGNANELSDSKLIRDTVGSENVIVLEKRLSFSELYEIISNASFIFGVDTGLVHLANALAKKLVAVYTDTDPKKTGVFETNIAKNIGQKNQVPNPEEIINLYEKIR